MPGDVSKSAEAQDIIEAALKNYDILVNNSGVYEYTPSRLSLSGTFTGTSTSMYWASSLLRKPL